MTDPSKYVNAYIDFSVGKIHEYLATNLQLKAQLRVVEELIGEKNNVINVLNNDLSNKDRELNDLHQRLNEVLGLQARVNELEQENTKLSSKAGTFNSFIKQVGDMKSIIKDKDAIIQAKDAEIKKLKDAQIKKTVKKNTKVEKIKKDQDDF